MPPEFTSYARSLDALTQADPQSADILRKDHFDINKIPQPLWDLLITNTTPYTSKQYSNILPNASRLICQSLVQGNLDPEFVENSFNNKIPYTDLFTQSLDRTTPIIARNRTVPETVIEFNLKNKDRLPLGMTRLFPHKSIDFDLNQPQQVVSIAGNNSDQITTYIKNVQTATNLSKTDKTWIQTFPRVKPEKLWQLENRRFAKNLESRDPDNLVIFIHNIDELINTPIDFLADLTRAISFPKSRIHLIIGAQYKDQNFVSAINHRFRESQLTLAFPDKTGQVALFNQKQFSLQTNTTSETIGWQMK